jgi:HEAT repeat protein
MKGAFRARLEQIISRLPQRFQDESRESTKKVLESGVQSYIDLLSIIADLNQELDVRITACWIAGQFGNKRAGPVLRSALSDASPRLRAQAAISLGRLQVRNAVQVLTQILLYDEVLDVRICAVHALGEMGDRRSTSVLIGRLLDLNEDPKLRGQAVEALINFPESKEKIIPIFLKMLQDNEPEIRFLVVSALGKIGNTSIIPELKKLASDRTEIPGWWSISKEVSDAIKDLRGETDLEPDNE